jgi:hypothetical protein
MGVPLKLELLADGVSQGGGGEDWQTKGLGEKLIFTVL